MKTNTSIRNQKLNEEQIEHNLTHNISIKQRQYLGDVDFYSPSRALIQKESFDPTQRETIWEDAKDCARKLNFFLIAQKASEPAGIHRANTNASLRLYSAIKFHIDGEKVEDIGERIEKNKQAASRYCERFIFWSKEHCESHLNTFTPKFVIEHCKSKVTPNKPLAEILDESRSQLTDLFHDLTEAAGYFGQQDTEVYLEIPRFQKTKNYTIDVAELLATI